MTDPTLAQAVQHVADAIAEFALYFFWLGALFLFCKDMGGCRK